MHGLRQNVTQLLLITTLAQILQGSSPAPTGWRAWQRCDALLSLAAMVAGPEGAGGPGKRVKKTAAEV